jgi:RNA polymerase sigma factor (sigma-70 family)
VLCPGASDVWRGVLRVARKLIHSGPGQGLSPVQSDVSSVPENRLSVSEWLASPYLGRAARRITYQYGLLPEDASDLLQELRLALLKAAPEALLNATWIFHTAMHKAVDILRQRRADPIAGRAPTAPERQAELFHLLHARADGLSRPLREFYALRFEQGLSQREAAEKLGVHRCHIRSLDRRCLRRIGGQVQLGRHRAARGTA